MTESASRWERVSTLFDEALELSPEQRRPWLSEACRDESVRRDVERMLAAHERSEGILEQPIPSPESVSDPYGEASQHGPQKTLTPWEGGVRGRQVGPYRLRKEIGRGGMGVVYRARDIRTDRSVALKFLPPILRHRPKVEERFLAEAKTVSTLDHPNICRLHEVGETEDGMLFIAMDYYRGETIARKIARGPLPIADAVDFAAQAALGLACSHQAGVIHRDIKPANLMVTKEADAQGARVKILDFGIAKLEDKAATQTGTLIGTVAYMSPEHLDGKRLDPRTDLWSLGVVLFEMLTGRLPFGDDNPIVLLDAILRHEPRSLRSIRPEVSEGLEEVVLRALAKRPAERLESASAFAAALERMHSFS